MNAKPLDATYEPILCDRCLASLRAQLTWLNLETLNLTCEIHGPMYAVQFVEAVLRGEINGR